MCQGMLKLSEKTLEGKLRHTKQEKICAMNMPVNYWPRWAKDKEIMNGTRLSRTPILSHNSRIFAYAVLWHVEPLTSTSHWGFGRCSSGRLPAPPHIGATRFSMWIWPPIIHIFAKDGCSFRIFFVNGNNGCWIRLKECLVIELSTSSFKLYNVL